MPPPRLPHGAYGIFISKGATIGMDCVIFQQVTIGSNTLQQSKKKGSPIIGYNCYIGARAKVIGNIKVGNNCRIGANCVVVEDVPDSSVVVLQKPRVLIKSNLDNKFLNYNDLT
jgi:serine O-acetyltransferase